MTEKLQCDKTTDWLEGLDMEHSARKTCCVTEKLQCDKTTDWLEFGVPLQLAESTTRIKAFDAELNALTVQPHTKVC